MATLMRIGGIGICAVALMGVLPLWLVFILALVALFMMDSAKDYEE